MILYPRIWIAAHGGPKTVAMSSDTPPAILWFLTKSPINMVRVDVALNPSTPKEALHELVSDKESMVQAAVAQNIRTDPADLAVLAQSKSTTVRVRTAENSRTPAEMLLQLQGDGEPLVRRAAETTIRQLRKRGIGG